MLRATLYPSEQIDICDKICLQNLRLNRLIWLAKTNYKIDKNRLQCFKEFGKEYWGEFHSKHESTTNSPHHWKICSNFKYMLLLLRNTNRQIHETLSYSSMQNGLDTWRIQFLREDFSRQQCPDQPPHKPILTNELPENVV